MVKMEFLKRKHFSLWIITAFVVVSGYVSVSDGLQGVPTWICLGVKSPFIEFSNEIEVLANNSIPLNITKDEQALMHQEGLRKLGTFIKPVDLRDSTTGYVKANLTKKIPSSQPQIHRRIHPIQEEMDQKQIILLDEETDENGLPASLTDEDRKFIVPMALKNPMPPDIRIPQPPPMFRTTTTPTKTTTTKTTRTTMRSPTIAAASLRSKKMTMPATPEFASNIDDLKNHLLFLQNLTKHDSNFQSKFVVFPSLQKDKPITSTTLRPLRPIFQYSAPIPPPTRKIPAGVKPGGQPFGGYYHNEDEIDSMSVFLSQPGSNPRDKITIVPQVLLLNDQTTNSAKNDLAAGSNNGRRRINTNRFASTQTPPFTTTTSTTTTPLTTTTEILTTTTTQSSKRPTKQPVCLRNPESARCIRQRKREEMQRKEFREQLLREQQQYIKSYEPFAQTLNNTKRFAVSIEIPDSFKIPYNETATTPVMPDESELQILSRSARSHHKRRNIGGGLQGRGGNNNEKFSAKYASPSFSFERGAIMTSAAVANERDFLLTHIDHMAALPNASTPSPTIAAYSEPTDLNPDNCYLVDGLTYGQKKQCVLHTSVMPAISRGARATIQECQYQFKNRRWNCSTVEDNTVFGPMTGLGSPEMAFIHALAAATVTSFIARACRDGQLASCGCSRGSRPKQLHDDWTWGGCGDNLEYAYKFATDFIDVREKETRRGTRGVGSPERRRGRLHQRRFQQQQQQQPMMQSDDANINGASTADKRLNSLISATSTNVKLTSTPPTTTTTTSTMTTTSTTMKTIRTKNGNGNASEDLNFKITIRNEDIKRQGMATATIDNNQQISNKTANSKATNNNNNNENENENYNKNMFETTTPKTTTATAMATSKRKGSKDESLTTTTTARSSMKKKTPMSPLKHDESSEEDLGGRIKPEDLLELQERITKEILNSKLQEKEMLELQEKINREILNSKVFSKEGKRGKRKRKNQRAINGMGGHGSGVQADAGYTTSNVNGGGNGNGNGNGAKWKNGASLKARSLMNLHNNEAGRRAVIKKTRITCKCHGVSGSCSLITCWQQLSSIREIGDYLRVKYEESTEVKLNKRGRLQVKDPQFKVPTAHDLVYLDESPDWCRNSRQLKWPGTHGRVCNKTSAGLDGCGILCCGRGYNTKNIVVRERCNCKFHWCCHVKCDVCVKVLEEHTCK